MTQKYLVSDNCELLIHLEDLQNCSTKWLVNKIELSDGTSKNVAVSNDCKNRDCLVCYDNRVVSVKKELNNKLKYIANIRHVILTFGKNVQLTREIKKRYHLYWYNYRRRLEKLGVKFAGVDIWEYKKQQNSLYHIHKHIAFVSVSPHHLTTAREWADTLGVPIVDTKTYYRVNKKNVINYFAKRVAGAGFDKTPLEYITLIKKSRLYNVFGEQNFKSYYNLELVSQHLNISDDNIIVVSTQLLFTIPKPQAQTIPPPQEDIDIMVENYEKNRNWRGEVPPSPISPVRYDPLDKSFVCIDYTPIFEED
jgi:hypothetical protein